MTKFRPQFGHFMPKIKGDKGIGYRQKIILKALEFYGPLKYGQLRYAAWFGDSGNESFQFYDTLNALIARGLVDQEKKRAPYFLTRDGKVSAIQISPKELFIEYKWYPFETIPKSWPFHSGTNIMAERWKEKLGRMSIYV